MVDKKAKKPTTSKTTAKKVTVAKTSVKKEKTVKVTSKDVIKEDKVLTDKKIEKKLEEFDWEQSNEFSIGYSKKEREDLEKLYTKSLHSVDEKELIEATVVGISNRDVVVNIGSKSDGIIPLSEFRDLPDLKLGDKVKVYVEEQENIKGQLILSRRKVFEYSGIKCRVNDSFYFRLNHIKGLNTLILHTKHYQN